MKFLFSLLIYSSLVPARDIVLISHYKQEKKAKGLSLYLQKEFLLPSALIFIKEQKQACLAHKESILQLCIPSQKKLKYRIVHLNKKVMKSSMATFIK